MSVGPAGISLPADSAQLLPSSVNTEGARHVSADVDRPRGHWTPAFSSVVKLRNNFEHP